MVFGAIVVSLVVIIAVLVYIVHTVNKQAQLQEFNKKTRRKK